MGYKGNITAWSQYPVVHVNVWDCTKLFGSHELYHLIEMAARHCRNIITGHMVPEIGIQNTSGRLRAVYEIKSSAVANIYILVS